MMHSAIAKDPRRVGMLMFLLSEAAFFCTLITAYIVFLRQTMRGTPSPAEVFHLPLVLASTACLLSSSVTVHIADQAFRAGKRFLFLLMWTSTIVLGLLFLAGTAKEWNELISNFGLTISRNMFGTTYFTLVGFHAAHVTIGVLMLCVILVLVAGRRISGQNSVSVEMVSWYWHFVDGVWLVVFTVVYVVGR